MFFLQPKTVWPGNEATDSQCPAINIGLVLLGWRGELETGEIHLQATVASGVLWDRNSFSKLGSVCITSSLLHLYLSLRVWASLMDSRISSTQCCYTRTRLFGSPTSLALKRLDAH